MTEEDSVVIYNRILSEEELLEADLLSFNGTSDYVDVGNYPFEGTVSDVRINDLLVPLNIYNHLDLENDKWYSIININGNIYIDSAFCSGERISEEEEMAFVLFLEKTIKEIIEGLTKREVLVIRE